MAKNSKKNEGFSVRKKTSQGHGTYSKTSHSGGETYFNNRRSGSPPSARHKKRKPYKDCITKIPLEEIEKNLMAALTKIGIVKNQIIIKDVGDYWNRSGKKFKKSKTIELVLKDFSLVNEILRKVKVRGVNSMRISDLKNKNISKYREQVKIEAMKAAKRKADYLLSSIGEKLGGVISVVELDGDFLNTWRNQNLLCNSKVNYTLSSNSDNLNKIENIRKIQLRYKIKIRFEIKQDVTSR